jgi:Ca-activated chloride channel homolog
MSFDRPLFLLVCLLAPLELLIARLRVPRLRRSLALLAGPERRERALSIYSTASIYGALASALCIVSVGLALAGPAWGSRAVSSEVSGLETALVLDVSRSMEVSESGVTRLAAAKSVVRELLKAAPRASFSLVAAKGGSVLLVPMTDDLDAIDSSLDYANPDTLSASGTDLESGIETALSSFTDREARGHLIVLLSDGGEHGAQALRAAAKAAKNKTRILAIGVGSGDPLPVPGPDGRPLLDSRGRAIGSALEPALLQAIASASGGRYFEASDPGSAAAIKAELGLQGKGGRRTDYEAQDRTELFAGLAALFLALRILSSLLSVAGGRP